MQLVYSSISQAHSLQVTMSSSFPGRKSGIHGNRGRVKFDDAAYTCVLLIVDVHFRRTNDLKSTPSRLRRKANDLARIHSHSTFSRMFTSFVCY